LLNRKNIITVLLVIAFFVVVYLATTNRSQHGDRSQWIKDHPAVVARHADLDKFCLDCHRKKFNHTKDNFCNACHRQSNVKLIK